ncbi:MAG: formylglycine-generating enzyme family protein [Clostridia bacterium]|nr:formylglycine-generating enzyme family protein [Clostridia bacterium]
MSRRLYSNHEYVKSGLVTGTMWDIMLKYMSDNGVDITSGNWGNRANTTLTNLSGYYTKIIEKSEAGKIAGETEGFKSAKTLDTTGICALLTTGSTEQVKKMNLYDISGNLWEWTEETAYSKGSNYDVNGNYNLYMLRGGGAETQTAGNSALYHMYYRAGRNAPNAWTLYGFRPVLFLQ